MTTIAFDTHAHVKKLMSAGFTEEQAEVQAVALKEVQEAKLENLATKGDIKNLELDIAETKGLSIKRRSPTPR